MKNQQFPIPGIIKMPIVNMNMARAMLATWCVVLGHGFHPDTRGADYITDENRTFTERQAKTYDASISQCFDICDAASINPYELAIEIYDVIFGLVDSIK